MKTHIWAASILGALVVILMLQECKMRVPQSPLLKGGGTVTWEPERRAEDQASVFGRPLAPLEVSVSGGAALRPLSVEQPSLQEVVKPDLGNLTKPTSQDDLAKSVTSVIFTDGFNQYKRVETSFGKWEWVLDDEANAQIAAIIKEKAELWAALRTRVLTPEEFSQVLEYGSDILTRPMQSYNQKDIDQRFAAGLEIQATLRRMEQWPKTYKAPDGVNTITENEDGTGSMTAVHVSKRLSDSQGRTIHTITQAEVDEVMTLIRDSTNAHNFALDFYKTAIVAFRSTEDQATIMANIRTVTESGKRLLEFEAKWRKRVDEAKP